MTDFDTLQKSFKDKKRLELALTHRSYLNENRKIKESNERIEFLGDAILEYVVSYELYRRFPDKNEGYLTALRANLVNTINLSQVARKLKVGNHLLLSKGEEEGGGRDNSSLLANTMEAIIGALYIDQGMAAAYEFIEENLLSGLKEKLKQPLKDPKSRLQEAVQAQKMPSPKYSVISESGPDHNKKFVVKVSVDGRELAKGEGSSKSLAEQAAAKAALAIVDLKS